MVISCKSAYVVTRMLDYYTLPMCAQKRQSDFYYTRGQLFVAASGTGEQKTVSMVGDTETRGARQDNEV